MRVRIVSRKLVKPSTSTPTHRRNLSISAVDQLLSPVYVGTIFYYPADRNSHEAKTAEIRVKQLEKSLAEILSLFYPMAGRYIKEDALIDCNDEGIEYLEGQVSGQLFQVLNGELQPEELNQFVPYPVASPTSPLIAVQINIFECGGLAVGFRMLHKIADGFTLISFLHGWATSSRVGIDKVACPSFYLSSLFPAKDVPGITDKVPIKDGVKIVTKSFLFSRTAISNLKAIVSADAGASRVDVVTALIWKALIKLVTARRPGQLRPSLVTHAVDVRGKTNLTIPKNSFGNLFLHAMARFEPNEKETRLHDLVYLVRGAIRDVITCCRKAIKYDDLLVRVCRSFKEVNEEMMKGDADVYMFSSWCGFPIYGVDFGWGKPSWVSGVHKPVQVVNLMDSKDGGIEAWLSLDEQDMILFQQDPDILAFTSSHLQKHCSINLSRL